MSSTTLKEPGQHTGLTERRHGKVMMALAMTAAAALAGCSPADDQPSLQSKATPSNAAAAAPATASAPASDSPSGSANATAPATTTALDHVEPPNVPADATDPKTAWHQPPSESTLKDDEFGRMVKLGRNIFLNTGAYAKDYVGNDLSCANCHLDAGRRADSAPLWAAFVKYPAYRSKTGNVSTYAARLQGCFKYSMNGKAPPADSEVITALQTYSFWLAKGVPVGESVTGGGYHTLAAPPQPADYLRGEKVYAANCAICHGDNGEGQRAGNRQVFPPLWGPRSFNWGAGMHKLSNAAAFIRANMPLGMGQTLSIQEAWDVAAFMNSHERPQDPRFTGSVAETRQQFHDSQDSLYGTEFRGHLLGSGV